MPDLDSLGICLLTAISIRWRRCCRTSMATAWALFLAEIAARYPDDNIVMVVDFHLKLSHCFHLKVSHTIVA
jgi:hypothetical protein